MTFEKNEKKIKNILTSVRIPEEVYMEIKSNRFRILELIQLGLLAKKNNPQFIKRLRDGELNQKNLTRRLDRLNSKVAVLEVKLNEQRR